MSLSIEEIEQSVKTLKETLEKESSIFREGLQEIRDIGADAQRRTELEIRQLQADADSVFEICIDATEMRIREYEEKLVSLNKNHKEQENLYLSSDVRGSLEKLHQKAENIITTEAFESLISKTSSCHQLQEQDNFLEETNEEIETFNKMIDEISSVEIPDMSIWAIEEMNEVAPMREDRLDKRKEIISVLKEIELLDEI